jgi:hypothetical protein
VSVATREDADTLLRSRVQFALRLFSLDIQPAFLQPLANREIEDGGNGHFTQTRFTLKIGLQLVTQTPTIYFRPHALHCGA